MNGTAIRQRIPSKISGQAVQVSGQFVELQSGSFVSALVSGTVQVASGAHVQISGQHVFVESGVQIASGTGVQVQSGIGVLISGQHVYVESGVGTVIQSGVGVVAQSGIGVLVSGQLTTASGIGVTINSGVGVTVQSGVILLSGVINATWLSGLQLASGGSILISGQGVIVGTATLSGLRLISGQSVTIDPATLSGLRLISGQSVTIASGTYVNWVQASGTIALQSGEIHVMSGTVTIPAPTTLIINNSGNPLLLDSNSGGIPLWSAAIVSVTVKALAGNSGDVYLGGSTAGQRPYSGIGFVLAPGEAINIDVDNTGKVCAMTAVSGRCYVSYLAIA